MSASDVVIGSHWCIYGETVSVKSWGLTSYCTGLMRGWEVAGWFKKHGGTEMKEERMPVAGGCGMIVLLLLKSFC